MTDLFRTGAAEEIRKRVHQEFSSRLQVMVNRLGPSICRGRQLFRRVAAAAAGLARLYLTRMAEEQGVLLRAADQYAMINGRAPNAVRLAIAGNLARQDYEAGLASLAHLLPRPPSDMAV